MSLDLPKQTFGQCNGSAPIPRPKKGSGRDERRVRNPAPEKPKPKPRKHIPQNVDRAVHKRAKGCCERCGKRKGEAGRNGNPLALHIHHVDPHCKGGADDFDNYALLCSDCNGALGASSEWKPEREKIDNTKIVSQLAAIMGKKNKAKRL